MDSWPICDHNHIGTADSVFLFDEVWKSVVHRMILVGYYWGLRGVKPHPQAVSACRQNMLAGRFGHCGATMAPMGHEPFDRGGLAVSAKQQLRGLGQILAAACSACQGSLLFLRQFYYTGPQLLQGHSSLRQEILFQESMMQPVRTGYQYCRFCAVSGRLGMLVQSPVRCPRQECHSGNIVGWSRVAV